MVNVLDREAKINADTLRSLFTYDSVTGVLRWRERHNGRIRLDLIAGHPEGRGYLRVCLFGKEYKVHRIVWCIYYGKWPTAEVDHIDGDRTNNSIKNLRDVTRAVNGQNQRKAVSSNSTSQRLGVSFCKRDNRFRATINAGGAYRNLGRFDTELEAAEAYLKAKRKLHAGCTI